MYCIVLNDSFKVQDSLLQENSTIYKENADLPSKIVKLSRNLV